MSDVTATPTANRRYVEVQAVDDEGLNVTLMLTPTAAVALANELVEATTEIMAPFMHATREGP